MNWKKLVLNFGRPFLLIRQIDLRGSSYRNKDRQIEEEAEKNEEELKFYKQKVKHLQYEHQNNLTEAKAEAMVSLKLAQDDHLEQEKELLRDKRELKSKTREQEMSNQDQIKALKLVSNCVYMSSYVLIQIFSNMLKN